MKTEGDKDLFGFESLDKILEVGGEKITLEENDALEKISSPKNQEELTVKVGRNGSEIQLKAKPVIVKIKREFVLEADSVFTKEVQDMRKWVLGL